MKRILVLLAASMMLSCAPNSDPAPSPSPDPTPQPPAPPAPAITPEQVLSEMKIPSSEADGKARAFPGAEGCGMSVTGGRGGRVIHVTTLSDSGAGSLREAISQKGARTVVFDVAGIIELKSRLEIKNGDLTIAGQTAPGDGICIKNYSTYVGADNVSIRFIRFRLGDEGPNAGDSDDALWGRNRKGIIIDHCSMSWSIDECASFYGNEDFTLQWCILTESLKSCSKHSKGSHGYGGIWGGRNASFHHNLLSNHDSRNPRFDHDYVSTLRGPVHFVNNVVYNWGANSSYGGESSKGAEPRQINVFANWYKPGPSSSNRSRLVNPTTKCSNCNSSSPTDIVPGIFYISDNILSGSDKVTSDNWEGVEPDNRALRDHLKSSAYLGSHTGSIHSAEGALAAVTQYAGASLVRDNVDKRACEQISADSGALIDDIAAVKTRYGAAWQEYKADPEQISRAVTDSDSDGIPDYYEDLFGLDKSDPSDGAAFSIDNKLKRYSNFELYLHYLVRDIVAGQCGGAVYKEIK